MVLANPNVLRPGFGGRNTYFAMVLLRFKVLPPAKSLSPLRLANICEVEVLTRTDRTDRPEAPIGTRKKLQSIAPHGT